MKNLTSKPVDLYTNTYNIEKAINEVFDYATREELSFEVNDAFDAIMAEVYDMRRTLKPMLNEHNKERVETIKRQRIR